MKILFVCRGNIARSQMAEAIFNNLSQGRHTAFSAGTKVIKNGVSREGQKVKDRDMQIVEVMKEIGLDVADYSRSQLTPEMMEEFDKVVNMAEYESVPEYLKESPKAIFWTVPDPKDQTLEFARDVRNQIQRSVADLIETLK